MHHFPLADIKMDGDGLVVFHNFPCPVCGARYALYQANIGVFMPCGVCEREGWRIFKPSRLQRIVGSTDTYESRHRKGPKLKEATDGTVTA